jgi:hypothetical protein
MADAKDFAKELAALISDPEDIADELTREAKLRVWPLQPRNLSGSEADCAGLKFFLRGVRVGQALREGGAAPKFRPLQKSQEGRTSTIASLRR